MASLNNVTVGDAYPNLGATGAILTFDPTDNVTIQVALNGAVYAQFALANPPGLQVGAYRNPTFTPEEKFLQPANYLWHSADFAGIKIVGVRFRNAVAGTNGQVTVSA